MKNAKRYILIALLVAVVFGAGYLNYRLGTTPQETAATDLQTTEDGTQEDTTVAATGDYFADYKTNREQTRQKEVAYLETIISDEKSDQETLKDAQEQKLAIVASMEKELTLEGLLNAKGFGETLVTVHEGAVNVVVKSNEITDQQAAQILDLVQQETDEPAKNIKIIPQS